VYDLDKKTNTELELPFKSMRTPILTPDRDKFLIVGSNDNTYDPLHGLADVLFEFDIKTKAHKTLLTGKGDHIIIQGWKRSSTQTKATPGTFKTSALSYYLPWDLGADYCVSRHGTPAPSGAHTYVSTCNLYTPGGQHSYAAVDFDTPNDRADNVRAAAAGQVTFAGISGSLTTGYGRLVIITHSDGTRTYYGHNSSLLVTSGQEVPQGHVVAKEGSTGGSTGDHIHFEFRAAGGSASTMGTFAGIGQPRQNFKYRSNNSTTAPVINTPGTYQIDINHTNQITKPDWNGLIGTEGNTITINGDKFTLFGAIQGTRDRGTFGEVTRDFAFNEGPSTGIGMRMEGLPAGTYNVSTWNYDPDYPGLVDVEFREAGLTATTQVKVVGKSLTDSGASTFQIVVEAGKNYEIVVRENSIEDRSRFNGISIILVP
ncbi:MAG TPA: M23 family metallopeptidase, partial [Sphingobacteriaceae bacterium]|nr:M23 family metallopeptidase [Sphingobacteriaceae bacterium]